MIKYLSILYLLIATSAIGQESVESIITKMDDNRTFTNSKMVGNLTITDQYGTRHSEFIAYTRGDYDSLIEFTSKAEYGQKILRTEDALYLYFPDSEEIITLRGSALKQSLLGSDISYEDLTADRGTLYSYDARLLGQEVVDSYMCHKIELIAKNKSVAYFKQVVWIDINRYVTLKGEYFSKSGRLIKKMNILEVIQKGGHFIPIKSELVDQLKRNTKTIMSVDTIDINSELDNEIFTLEHLSW
ncbi:outer membrane lipoprotein-sorting protein [Spirochaeta cellobiosiphila]|uniref:outer membrane lipoprotein-sorting protein n=1 Tax=Spirochaeta cellobiosiphila TaxID=504483 RepID=UPI000421F2EC|nr:outer membrane lipoprotein-sorting protein [Spirochaeta cellobiosiphila]